MRLYNGVCNSCYLAPTTGYGFDTPSRTSPSLKWPSAPPGHIHSATKNVVYCITCTKCGKLYIGETKRMLRERFREHLRDIRISNMTSPVAQHFTSRGHSTEDITVCCLLICSTDTQRKQMEMRIIDRLGTLDPLGLNLDFTYGV